MEKQALISKLSQGEHRITFTKKDGSVTERLVTADPTLCPVYEPKTGRITKQSLDTVRVYDLENEKYISLIPNNVFPF